MSSGSSYPINGHHVQNGSASHPSSTPDMSIVQHPDFRQPYHANGYPPNIFQDRDQKIVNHLYENGFKHGEYADILLHVYQNVYRLHALILSRSPFLAHLMSTSPQANANGLKVIYVPLDTEPEITLEGFYTALGYLYSSHSLHAIQPHNARAVLAAGCLLGGMEELCEYAYETCKRSITVDSINSWLEFIDKIPSASNGSEIPEVSSVFGFYAQRIRDDVFHFLVVTLPEVLELHNTPADNTASSPEPNGREILLQVFSRVPFEMFKAAVESPSFQIGSDQARFKFAKEAVEARKRGIARGSGCEETVVLAFGGGNSGGSAVHVTRKMRKRPLWKVNS